MLPLCTISAHLFQRFRLITTFQSLYIDQYFNNMKDNLEHESGNAQLIDPLVNVKRIDADAVMDIAINAPNSYWNIDKWDFDSLFEKENETIGFEIDIKANAPNRMQLLVEWLDEEAKHRKTSGRFFVFLVTPTDHTLLLAELKPLSQWVDTHVNRIMWGGVDDEHQTEWFKTFILLQ